MENTRGTEEGDEEEEGEEGDGEEGITAVEREEEEEGEIPTFTAIKKGKAEIGIATVMGH